MRVDKAGIAGKDFALIALVKALSHVDLLFYDVVSMVQNIREAGARQVLVTVIKGVLIEFDDTADRLAQRFGRNGSPMGAAAAHAVVAFDHRDASPLFSQAHRGAFATRSRADNQSIIVIMWLHSRLAYYYTKSQR